MCWFWWVYSSWRPHVSEPGSIPVPLMPGPQVRRLFPLVRPGRPWRPSCPFFGAPTAPPMNNESAHRVWRVNRLRPATPHVDRLLVGGAQPPAGELVRQVRECRRKRVEHERQAHPRSPRAPVHPRVPIPFAFPFFSFGVWEPRAHSFWLRFLSKSSFMENVFGQSRSVPADLTARPPPPPDSLTPEEPQTGPFIFRS